MSPQAGKVWEAIKRRFRLTYPEALPAVLRSLDAARPELEDSRLTLVFRDPKSLETFEWNWKAAMARMVRAFDLELAGERYDPPDRASGPGAKMEAP